MQHQSRTSSCSSLQTELIIDPLISEDGSYSAPNEMMYGLDEMHSELQSIRSEAEIPLDEQKRGSQEGAIYYELAANAGADGGSVECPICCEDVDKLFELDCGHSSSCYACVQRYCKAQIFGEHTMGKINCDMKCLICWRHITGDTLMSVLGSKLYSDFCYFSSLRNNKTFASYKCPNEKCENGFMCVPLDGAGALDSATQSYCSSVYNKKTAECPSCQAVVCRVCSEKGHAQAEKCPAKSKSKNILHSAGNRMWCAMNTNKCPNCKVNIEKKGGCPHMTCANCSHYFCWKCKKQISRGGKTRCYCISPFSTKTGEVLTIGGLVVVVPLVTVAAIVVVPPVAIIAGIIYAPFYIKEKSQKKRRAKWHLVFPPLEICFLHFQQK
eukprot:TRINITY_DN333_c0_g1_i1.p1 TRINITY_DN333_c0_g1~~TRINITY_DN333_c0_g1_i1.p1  ORF type:complete len:392 (+),score=77.78 TRINITY_DN333_c0_g1_i1:30-1178(+)